MSAPIHDAFKKIPDGLRNPLISEFEDLIAEYRSGRWESVGLKAGKLCEIVFTIIKGFVDGNYPPHPSKPSNMVVACQQLEQAGSGFSRSIRIQIPRLLISIYELRNNRDIGHVGGEVNPNHMDAELFLRAGKWLVSELIRIFAKADPESSKSLVESVTEKILPAVWEGDGVKRVLNADLSSSDKALLLAYCSPNATAKEIATWIGYSNLSRFQRSVLRELHDKALINFDLKTGRVKILPTGTHKVETSGLLVTRL